MGEPNIFETQPINGTLRVSGGRKAYGSPGSLLLSRVGRVAEGEATARSALKRFASQQFKNPLPPSFISKICSHIFVNR